MRTIAHISDLHFGRVDPAIVESLVEDLHAQSPSLMIMSGDFTQRARAWQYQAAASFMQRLPQPQLVVPGNHDIPLFDVVRRFFFPLQKYRQFITADLSPVFEDDELFVIGVNTARPFTFSLKGFWKDGRISEAQLQNIQHLVNTRAPMKFRIVVTHHPFIPPPHERFHGIVHNAARALDQMERSHIDMLLAGHLHMGYSGDVRTHHETAKRSILSIQAGTATSTRRRGEPNAYNLITIKPDDVTIQVRAWNGAKFTDAVLTHFFRSNGIWQESPA